jgi:adenylate cyclase
LSEAEEQRAIREPSDSLDAWEGYHHGGPRQFSKQESATNQFAKPFFQRAIDLDPNFAGGHYGLAMSHFWDVALSVASPSGVPGVRASAGAACCDVGGC